MLPAAAARFWTQRLEPMCVLAVGIGLVSGAVGLLVSYHLSVASGPAIILTAGAFYGLSLLFGSRGLIAGRGITRHRTA
jgi:zinc/manganese transport system permease protein